MDGSVRVFSSFAEAEEAELRYYASLTPDERVAVLLGIIAKHRESLGESAQRFERVYRVTELSRS